MQHFPLRAQHAPITRWLALALLMTFLLGSSAAFAGDLVNFFTGSKKNLGANSPCFPGCPQCDDYCAKPLICQVGPKACNPGCYCPKPIPCVTGPKACNPGCYCPKPLPPFCDPKCQPRCAPCK